MPDTTDLVTRRCQAGRHTACILLRFRKVAAAAPKCPWRRRALGRTLAVGLSSGESVCQELAKSTSQSKNLGQAAFRVSAHSYCWTRIRAMKNVQHRRSLAPLTSGTTASTMSYFVMISAGSRTCSIGPGRTRERERERERAGRPRATFQDRLGPHAAGMPGHALGKRRREARTLILLYVFRERHRWKYAQSLQGISGSTALS